MNGRISANQPTLRWGLPFLPIKPNNCFCDSAHRVNTFPRRARPRDRNVSGRKARPAPDAPLKCSVGIKQQASAQVRLTSLTAVLIASLCKFSGSQEGAIWRSGACQPGRHWKSEVLPPVEPRPTPIHSSQLDLQR